MRHAILTAALLVCTGVPAASAAPMLVFDNGDVLGSIILSPLTFDLRVNASQSDGHDPTLGDYVVADLQNAPGPSTPAFVFGPDSYPSNRLVVATSPSNVADLRFNFETTVVDAAGHWTLFGTGSPFSGTTVSDPALLPFLGAIRADLSYISAITDSSGAVVGHAFDLDQITPVPEPGTLALVALGLAGAAARRRRKRQQLA